jgi:hypothetical protein
MDIFDLLEADLKKVREQKEAQDRLKNLSKTAHNTTGGVSRKDRAAAKAELAELQAGLEEAKWRPVEVMFVTEHANCKSCGSETVSAVGLFIKRETTSYNSPKAFSKKRTTWGAVLENHPLLPRTRAVIAKQIDQCPACIGNFGWPEEIPGSAEVILMGTEKTTITAADFFGE